MGVRILVGDVRERLRDLPDGSVQCVVTSPPYFGLRDYGTASWDGGDPACDHKPPARQPRAERPDTHGFGTRSVLAAQDDGAMTYRSECRKCGAVRVDNQIGLEGTLSEYIATLVEVFRDVRRVLHPTGTVWLNLGDSYAGNGTTGRKESLSTNLEWPCSLLDQPPASFYRSGAGLKPKDLMMVPARVAIALQDDGWYLRSDIIWAKKNCMPESVTDRPTSSHEHIFLLTKQSRYFYDAEAVREEGSWNREAGEDWTRAVNRTEGVVLGRTTNPHGGVNNWQNLGSRNQRNVWSLATEPFPLAHFATFPTEIPRRCIAAGTSERGQCAACGAPWVRVVERPDLPTQPLSTVRHTPNGTHKAIGQQYEKLRQENPPRTTGWRPSCSCDADVVPQTVLDPFLGSGTTLLVADRLGRNGIGVELSPDYAAMAEDRIRGDAPLFADVAAD